MEYAFELPQVHLINWIRMPRMRGMVGGMRGHRQSNRAPKRPTRKPANRHVTGIFALVFMSALIYGIASHHFLLAGVSFVVMFVVDKTTGI
jgi:hypothetical protein